MLTKRNDDKRGMNIAALSGTVPFALGVTQFHWNLHDVKYKHEANGPPDYREGGTLRRECRGHEPHGGD